ncbi:dihydrofolate reductase family protein [Tenggerimyces flavus]|uniref:Dihydrofolate reductase family protein n=1 Tax=Tenggerimyces flavus TaxID=1708749 RepID=A0ABV7YK55_9ACTN|nr:dihydrofolate reductase family protein [Tenggerimyces flavus]MBM7789547.1 dihydrofolate reductase [Tenggerimyces flavus]
MRNVVLYQLLSLDGVAEEPGDWMSDGGSEIFDNLGQVIESQDAILLGRGTYDYWAGYWPTSELAPFAPFINGTTKHVFTSSKPDQDWPNSTFVDSPAEAYVADLKRQDGGDIGIHGSIKLSQALLRASLVDELRLVVASTVAGSGRRLFDDDALKKLELRASDRTPGGSLLLHYKVASPE